MSLSRGRITSHGYVVEVSDRLMFTRLHVSTPTEIIHEGPEPDHEMTQRGSVIIQVGPIVLFALMVAILLPLKVFPPLTPVAVMLLLALGLYLRIRLSHGRAGDPTQRAIDHAWSFIVPEMHRPNFRPKDAEFLAGLAVTSIGIGSAELRERSLERACKLTRERLTKRAAHPEEMAALRCLEIDDAMRLGRDPVPLLSDELSAVLAGELPIQYGEQLLETWPNEARNQGQRARLRILLIARAFELGFETRDLTELGRVSIPFGQVYASEDVAGLSRLRWLWDGKTERVWAKNGSATTVFDLARYPALGGEYLEARPDLLLFQLVTVGDEEDGPSPILICESGVVYRNIMIKDPDLFIGVRARSSSFELSIGKQKLVFQKDPAFLATRLQGWVRFLYKELLPGARDTASRRTAGKLRSLFRQKTIICPECRNSFLALRGDVGIVTDSKKVR